MVKKKKSKKAVISREEKDNSSLYKKTLSMLNHAEGASIFETLKEVKNKPTVGISTGSVGIDYVICPKAGGMPKGQVIEMYGAYSTGKSTIALGLCANVTANKENVIYVDCERSFSWEGALNAGIDEDYFTLCQHRDARLIANDLETLMKTGEVGMVVIDSVPFWKPLLESKKGSDDVDITKSQMAFHASFLTNTIPILAQAASDHDVTLVLVNQVRKLIGSYGGGTTSYGCEALKHLNSVRLKLTGTVRSKDDRIIDSSGNLLGQYVNVVADKNKLSGPMREVKVPLFFGRGINPFMEMAMLSIKTDVVDSAGSWIKWKDSGESIAQGINNYTQLLYDDQEVYLKIRQEVLNKLGVVYNPNRVVINSFQDNSVNKSEGLPVELKNEGSIEDLEETLEADE